MRVEAFVFAVCAVACVVAHLAILRSVIRARVAVSDPGVPRPKLLVEVAWAILPAVALAFVLTATWARIQERDAASPPSPLMRVAQ